MSRVPVSPDASAGQAHPPRLKKRSEFLAARSGQKKRGPYFLMEVHDRRDEAPARVGFTVTKKTGNAVIRNRIKRRLREAVRVHAQGAMRAGHDYVLIGRPDCLSIPFETLAGEMVRRIGRTGSHGK